MDSGFLIVGGFLILVLGGGATELVRQMTAQPLGGNMLSWFCLALGALGALFFCAGVHREWIRAARRRAVRGGR